jgi:hypothetical protein
VKNQRLEAFSEIFVFVINYVQNVYFNTLSLLNTRIKLIFINYECMQINLIFSISGSIIFLVVLLLVSVARSRSVILKENYVDRIYVHQINGLTWIGQLWPTKWSDRSKMMAKIDWIHDDRISGVCLFGHHIYDDLIFGQNMTGQWNDRSYFKPTIYQIGCTVDFN